MFHVVLTRRHSQGRRRGSRSPSPWPAASSSAPEHENGVYDVPRSTPFAEERPFGHRSSRRRAKPCTRSGEPTAFSRSTYLGSAWRSAGLSVHPGGDEHAADAGLGVDHHIVSPMVHEHLLNGMMAWAAGVATETFIWPRTPFALLKVASSASTGSKLTNCVSSST